MTTTKHLLEERGRVRARRPKFLRSGGHMKAEVPKKWRAPRGLQNKMRREMRGHRRVVKAGWGSPQGVRGTDAAGLMIVRVSTLTAMNALDPKRHCVVIAGSVGLKRTVVLMAAAKTKGIKVLNLSEEQVRKRVAVRDVARSSRSVARVEKAKKVKDAEKKAEKVEAEAAKKDEVSEDPEERKRKEKEERDRAITKRES